MNQPTLNPKQTLDIGQIVSAGNEILVQDSHHTRYAITYISEQVTALQPDDTVLFMLTNHEVIICHKLNSVDRHLPCVLTKQINDSTVRLQHECAQIDLHKDGQIQLKTGQSEVQINRHGEVLMHGESIVLTGDEQICLNSTLGNVSVITQSD